MLSQARETVLASYIVKRTRYGMRHIKAEMPFQAELIVKCRPKETPQNTPWRPKSFIKRQQRYT